MAIRIGPDIVIGRHGISLSGGSDAAVDWWLSGGIPAANAVAVYQPIGAASLAASYVNLANPGTYDAAPGTAPTFDAATGWAFDGTAQYLATGVAPANDRSWSMIVRFADGVTGTGVLLGSYINSAPATDRGFFIRPNESARIVFAHGAANTKVAPGVASGVLAVAGLAGYRDGSAVATLTGAAPSPTVAITIGGLNFDSTLIQFIACKIQAVAIYSATLTAGQVAAVSTAMAAL